MIVRVVSFVDSVGGLVVSFCGGVWVMMVPGVFGLVVFVWGYFWGRFCTVGYWGWVL